MSRHNRTPPLLGLLLVGMLALPSIQAASTGPQQSHASIRETVKRFLLSQAPNGTGKVEIEVRRLDTRLRLARCDQPLETRLPPSGRKTGRVTVGVRCNGTSPWSLYVPARVVLLAEVVVVQRALRRGQRIDESDLALEEHDLARQHRAYFTRIEDVAGKIADRAMQTGRILHPALLDDPLAIERGSRVNIIARIGGIQASMRGQALDNGSLGERIRIRNLDSKRELEARVVSAGTVRVDI